MPRPTISKAFTHVLQKLTLGAKKGSTVMEYSYTIVSFQTVGNIAYEQNT